MVLADVSGSMHGEKIAVLNRSISAMLSAFGKEDSARGEIHVAVVAFGGETAQVHQPMVPASRAVWADMAAAGRTPLGAALDLTRTILDDPTAVPGRAFPPTLILVSDGAPTDEWEVPLNDLLSGNQGRRALRLAVGIGSDRTPECEEVLMSFCTPGVDILRADQVHQVAGLFRWVTATVTGHLHESTGRQAIRLKDLDIS
ncbi:vWA domain-containing protein [Micromonospora aurantiaca (nom. illeg.)]|uniref:vWA domain-containing protein n=1 Tax=Micromonospora aurantiaca (nom. illeg.) TaxID=47850 RepID=UPI003F4A048B